MAMTNQQKTKHPSVPGDSKPDLSSTIWKSLDLAFERGKSELTIPKRSQTRRIAR